MDVIRIELVSMKNLLIITTRYPHEQDKISATYIKAQVDVLKKSFEKVVVISTTPYIPMILTKFLMKKRSRDALAMDYSYDNVDVYFTKDLVLPFEFSKQRWGGKAYNKMMKILNRINFKPDIVHAHRTWPTAYSAMLLSKETGTPYVVTAHGYDAYGLPYESEKWCSLLNAALSPAKKIIAVSERNSKVLSEVVKIPKEKLVVIPNGYDENMLHPIDKKIARKKLGLPLDKKIILSVGFLYEVKGYNYLIQAAHEIISHHKDVLFVIVGDGNSRVQLEKQIEELKLKDRFLLVGNKDFSEIPYWMNAADIFTLSSNDEGVPTVLFEAIGCGKPYVGTNVGGIPEIVINDKLGLLVPPKEPKQLAAAMEKAMMVKWDQKYILEHAERYTWNIISNEILNIYNEALNSKSSTKQ